MNASAIDYDGLMQANLARVFGEHDAGKRLKAIRELYTEDAVLNELGLGHMGLRLLATGCLPGE